MTSRCVPARGQDTSWRFGRGREARTGQQAAPIGTVSRGWDATVSRGWDAPVRLREDSIEFGVGIKFDILAKRVGEREVPPESGREVPPEAR